MATKGRRIVDALDDLTAELRVANQIAVLGMGAASLEDEPIKADAVEKTRDRIGRRNALRGLIRKGVGL